MRIRTLFAAAGLLASTAAVAAPAATDVPAYSAVTPERLASPEDHNWLQYRRTYDSWGYSPLDAINRDNVGDLEVAWSFATGVVEAHQSPPVVNDGMMFITTPSNQVIALDARQVAFDEQRCRRGEAHDARRRGVG